MMLAKFFSNIFNPVTTSEDRGLIEVNGVFEGNISDGSKVIITPSGRFYGKIKAKNVGISGLVDGDVHTDNLVICSQGQLYFSELNCQRISIKDGGSIIKKGDGNQMQYSEVDNRKFHQNYTEQSNIKSGGNGQSHLNGVEQNSKQSGGNGQSQIDDAVQSNKQLQDNQETEHTLDKTCTLQIKERPSYSNHTQLRFYNSY